MKGLQEFVYHLNPDTDRFGALRDGVDSLYIYSGQNARAFAG